MHANHAPEGAEDQLDATLRQIVGGYFVLTDGQGSISKWSEPAELLFGRPAEEVLGQSFFQTLVQAPLPDAAGCWRRFLESAEPPAAAGRIEVSGLHAEDLSFPMEAVFVPVKLDEGFDFSLFLEDLGFELPQNLMLQRMRAQHPVVVRALRQALEPVPQPWEGWRTAGTLVIFRPLAATPWVDRELAVREAARAEADAEVEERLTILDPGIQGGVNDLDDAAAVVARLLSAMERIDELERVALGLPAQLDEALQHTERRAETTAEAVRAEHAATIERLEHLQRESDALRAELAALDTLRTQLESLQADSGRVDALHEQIAALQAGSADLAALRTRVDTLDAGAAQVNELRARLDSLDAGAAQVNELRARLDSLDDGEAALGRDLESLRSAEEALRARLAELETAAPRRADEADRRIDDLAGDVNRRLDDIAARAEAANAAAETARETGAAVHALEQRILDVDRGAGTVLADVRALSEHVDTARAETTTAHEAAAQARAEAAAASEAAAQARAEAAAASEAAAAGEEQATAIRAVAEESRDEVQALQAQLEAVRAEARGAREDAAAAREAALAGEQRVERMQAELASAQAAVEELKAAHAGHAAAAARREAEQAKRAEGPPAVHDVFQQLIAAATRGGGGAARRNAAAHGRPAPAQRMPRQGFDDATQPQAILGIEGRFRELNPSFARLVGYKEHEFSKAAWPSPHDRAVYQEQQEQLRRLVSGEIDSLSVQSTYMHGQGLMVPVVGTLKVVRDGGGQPLHLLLQAEERHTG